MAYPTTIPVRLFKQGEFAVINGKKYVPERTVNLTEAVDAICGEMCGDGWDWRNRAEAVVKTVAEMCGAKVVGE